MGRRTHKDFEEERRRLFRAKKVTVLEDKFLDKKLKALAQELLENKKECK